MSAEWRDVSSYSSRFDPEWEQHELYLDHVKLLVYHRKGKKNWLGDASTFRIQTFELRTSNLAAAKRKLVQLCRAEIDMLAQLLDKAPKL